MQIMNKSTFRALVVEEQDDGQFARQVRQRPLSDLPDAEVCIRVKYSSLNYKDALSANGHRGVTKKYPHTPGIDAAGVVFTSKSNRFSPGDEILVTGYDLGMNTSGGLGDLIAVPADWIVAKPVGLSAWECMALGTAGFTAALCLQRLQIAGLTPTDGEVLITGASGGVGSIALALLNHLGYRVVAVTGKVALAGYLKKIGATEVLAHSKFTAQANQPLLRARWAGAIDTLGGTALDAVLKSIKYGGAVASCGMAESPELRTNVYPFILRNISLLGIASAECDMETRCLIWSKLGGPWRIPNLTTIVREVDLDEVNPCIDALLDGTHHGRTVVKLTQDQT